MKFLENKMHVSREECEESQDALFSQENTSILKKILSHAAHQLADNSILLCKDTRHHFNRHLRDHGPCAFFSSTPLEIT